MIEICRRSLIGVLFIWGLSAYAQTGIPTIGIDPKTEQPGALKLSDLVQSAEYIPLETTDDCLIGGVSHFDISDRYIVVGCYKSTSVYLFGRDGRFIRKIGRAGQGPAEYLQINYLRIDEAKNELAVFDYTKVIFYDLSGKHLRTQKLVIDQDLYLDYSGDRLVTGIPSGFFSNKKYSVYRLYDIKPTGIKPLGERIPAQTVVVDGDKYGKVALATYSPPVCSYIFDDRLHVYELTLNDTVYTVEKDNTFKPCFILSVGKYAITAEMRADIMKFADNTYNSVALFSVFETQQYVMIYYMYRKKLYYEYYDKSQKQMKRIQSDKGIPNDYDGGLDFWPFRWPSSQRNKRMCQFYEAHEFEGKKPKEQGLRGPKSAIQKVKSFYKISPEDNPVLVIYNMK